MLRLVALTILVILANTYQEENNLLVLTDDDFDQAVK